MKKVLFLAFVALLWACGDDESSSMSKDVQMLLDSKKGFSEDSVIYLADTVNFVDKINQHVDFGTKGQPEMYYAAKALTSGIDVQLYVDQQLNDGSIVVRCNPALNEKIIFDDPVFPATTKNGNKLSFKDSLKVADSTYYDIIVFNATDSSYNVCNISAFYYGIHDGLVRVVSKNGVTLNRVPAKVYEAAEDRRAKEKAIADSIAQVVADSIAQAVADSIAQAVADSIVKANTVDSSGSDGDSIAIPQEVVDLAEAVAECIKKAYSAGSLSAIKDCEI